ncbi:PH domain-containing protein [Acetivibrio clariflavus]|uniref:PH domain-containing protein n=1 Tax=Acetivibrio clariflavus TaxID=288965 RepID=UPI0004B6EAB8|nr:PH domain-containing protein [Acetivibrio clariflavus]
MPVGILNIALIFVAVLIFFSSRPAEVTFIDEGVQIHGMYGGIYPWNSIKTVELIDELPAIQRRTNGSAVNSMLKGYFLTKEIGTVKLFVNTQKPPFIYIETEDEVVIFNTENADETQKIFGEIQKRIE